MLIIISQINNDNNYEKFLNFPKILIYNKSNIEIDDYINHKNVYNKGDHVHSLFHYIYTNYDNLMDEYYLFISLNNELYEEDFPSKIFFNKLWNYVINEKTLNIDYKCLSDYIIEVDSENILNKEDPEYLTIDLDKINNLYKEIYIELFNTYESTKYKHGEGYDYLLSKKIILSRSRDFYSKILNILEKDDEYRMYRIIIIEILTGKIFTNNLNADADDILESNSQE